MYWQAEFTDDVKGGLLNKEAVVEARKLEMDYFKKMQVYKKIKRSDMPAGSKLITTKWVDTNKGSEEEPNYRSRLVGREIKTNERPDLFAATPPLESLRYVLSKCASTESHRILSIDAKKGRTFTRRSGGQFSSFSPPRTGCPGMRGWWGN